MVYNPVPSIVTERGLARYIEDIQKFPLLQPKEEYDLAQRYQRLDDIDAAHKLVTSHLRYVVKIALGYRGYGLPISEIISEGNIGLMRAVKGFLPEKGARLATYAMWWIKSSIHEYVLRSWSLVKIGTTSQQKKLFFNLRKAKNKILAFGQTELNGEQIQQIAGALRVSESEVKSMDQRLAGDQSLNLPICADDQQKHEWQDVLVDEAASQEQLLLEQDEINVQRSLLQKALNNLKVREKEILQARRLQDVPETLEALGQLYNISRERVRQIEARAFEKVQSFIAQQLQEDCAS